MWTERVAISVLAAGFVLAVGCPQTTPGASTGVVNVDGQLRTYRAHVPPRLDGSASLPLVIALHPFATTARYMELTTRFSRLADEQGFVVVYPNARTRLWNGDPTDELEGGPAAPDDARFIEVLIDALLEEYAIDASRVYVCGASNGALMAQRLACSLTDRFAAAASVMTTLPADWDRFCVPAGPIPMLLLHGLDDPFFPSEGGLVHGGPLTANEYGSIADMVAFWVSNNGALSPPATENLPDADPDDGTTVWRETYAAGADGAEVVFYGIDGGGHTWPGSVPAMEPLLGATSQDIDASRVIWDFFAQHANHAKHR